MGEIFGIRVDLELIAKNLDKVKKQVTAALGDVNIGSKGSTSSGGASSALGMLGKIGGYLGVITGTTLIMKGIMNRMMNTLQRASPALDGTFRILDLAKNQFFRPYGDFLAASLRPLSIKLLDMSTEFIKFARTQEGQESIQDAMAAALGSVFGASFFSILGGIVGFATGGPAGAVAGSAIGMAGGALFGAGVGKTASDIQQYIDDYMDALKEGADTTEDRINDLEEGLDSGISNGVSGVFNALELGSLKMGEAITGGVTMMGDTIESTTSPVYDAVKGGFDVISDTLGLLSPVLGEKADKMFTEILDTISEKAKSIFGPLKSEKIMSGGSSNMLSGLGSFNPATLSSNKKVDVKNVYNISAIASGESNTIEYMVRSLQQKNTADLKRAAVLR